MRRIYADDLPYDPNVSRTPNFNPNEIGTARPIILDTLNDGVGKYLETISRLHVKGVLKDSE